MTEKNNRNNEACSTNPVGLVSEEILNNSLDCTGDEPVSTKEWAVLAASRSRVYGFLSAVYNRLPDEKFAERLRSFEMSFFISSLEGIYDWSEDMREGIRLLKQFIEDSAVTSIDELKTDIAVERTRLLRGLKPEVSPPPPYESIYISVDDNPKMQATVSVRQFYADEGVGLPDNIHDQADFIGLELDFMRYLCSKESEAWQGNEREKALKYLEKERAFLEGHIIRWIPRFCDVALKWARQDFFRGVALITKGFVIDEVGKVVEYPEWSVTARNTGVS